MKRNFEKSFVCSGEPVTILDLMGDDYDDEYLPED